MHKNYLNVLRDIENEMGKPIGDYKKYSEDEKYSMGGFNIRYLNYRNEMSNHSFGMAIDVDAEYNPQKFAPTWTFVYIITNYKMLSAKLNPTKMLKISNLYKSANINQDQIDKVKAGLDEIDKHNDSYMYDITNIQDIGPAVNDLFLECKRLYNKIQQHNLRLLVLTESEDDNEKNRINHALNIQIPNELDKLKEKTLTMKDNVASLNNILEEGYESAFKTKERYPYEHEYIDSYLNEVESNVVCLEDILNDIFIYVPTGSQLPSCFKGHVDEEDLKYDLSRITSINNIVKLMYEHNKIAFDTYANKGMFEDHKFNLLREWIHNNTNSLIKLSEKRFFRLEPSFVNYFLNNGKVRWGGHYNTAIDCMHFELEPNEF